jgi:hypothetical protein
MDFQAIRLGGMNWIELARIGTERDSSGQGNETSGSVKFWKSSSSYTTGGF